jgi:hypothetical protein
MRKDAIKVGLRAGALSAFALLVGAQASVAAVVLEGDDVITYEHTVTLAGASRSIIEGERLPDGGCRFSQSRTLDREATVTELELAFEPATCRSLIESGKRVSGDVLPEAGAQSQARTESVSAAEVDAAGSTEAGIPSSFTRRVRASLHSFYEDPPNFNVTDVTNEAEWTADGTCANVPGTSALLSYRLDWLAETGWGLQSQLFSFGGDCNGVISQSDTHYKNGVFCAFFDTDNYYEPNRVEGRPDGTAVLTWTQRKEGPCDFLLSANQEYSWTVVG